MSAASFWQVTNRGLAVRVRVTPRGGRDGLDGAEALSDGRGVLKIRVRAAPEDGAATEAVRQVLAAAAGRPPSAVRLASGARARVKTFTIEGDAALVRAALVRRAEGSAA